MAKKRVDPFRSVYPSPVALITSVTADGRPNIIALAEVFNVSLGKPPIVGISVRKATFSHGLIAESRQFVINFPTPALLQQTETCGNLTGRSSDKFAITGLTAVPASTVRPPLIAECPVNLECRVIELRETGDHDLFLGEVVFAHADDMLLDAEGRVLYERLDPLIFMSNFGHRGEYWTLGKMVGRRGQ